jgi:hypothetical protein
MNKYIYGISISVAITSFAIYLYNNHQQVLKQREMKEERRKHYLHFYIKKERQELLSVEQKIEAGLSQEDVGQLINQLDELNVEPENASVKERILNKLNNL